MKKILSKNRTTGHGAVHYTAILQGNQWIPVANMPGNMYEGREQGFMIFSVNVPDDAISGEFYRSNRGNEKVTVRDGIHGAVIFHSFQNAEAAAASGSLAEFIRKDQNRTCPNCGEPIA